LRIGGLSHPVGLFVNAIVDERIVSPKLLDQSDDFGGLLLAQYREFETEQFSPLHEAIIALLRRQDQHNEIERSQRRGAGQPRERGRIERPEPERGGEAIQTQPAENKNREDRKEPGSIQEGRYPVDRALVGCGVGAVFRLQPLDGINRFFDMDGRWASLGSRQSNSRSSIARELSPDQPQDDEHNQDNPEDAAESGAAILAMGVVAATAAEDQNQQNNDKNGAHGPASAFWRYGFFNASRTASLTPPTAF
jgi:hypothetical protein